MNLVSLFTKKERIAGLEISDAYLRIALLTIKEKEGIKKAEVVFLKEEPLTQGIVVDGIIQNKNLFSSTLKKLLKGLPTKLKFGIISLPPNKVYSHTFTFPKSVEGRRLEETIKLAVDFQLPMKPTDVYLDWEKVEPAEESKIFLAAAPKAVVDDYLAAADSVGFGIIAVEFHPISFGRVIDLPKNESAIVTSRYESGVVISVIRDWNPEFSRYLPKEYLAGDSITEEVRKVKDFYESKDGKIGKVIDLSESKAAGKLGHDAKLQPESGKWLVSVGAALRGLLPRADDNLVSMMPVGTEEAYEYHKAIVFAKLLSDFTIGLSIVFSATFIGTWLFMLSMQQNLITLSGDYGTNMVLPADTVSLENRAASFNSLMAAAGEIIGGSPRWSVVFEEIRAKLVPGISINTADFNLSSLFISGTAKNRNQLNSFKQSLESSPLFAGVTLPLTNLNQKENIPFSMSLSLKDRSLISYTNVQ
jgi:Tfp pilus assembly PilM family ATPase